MGFFDLPPPPERPEEEAFAQPEWWGPAEGEVPGVVAIEKTLAETDQGAIYLDRVDAFRHGFVLAVRLLFREDRNDSDVGAGWWAVRSGSDPEDLFRIGVQYADGAKATNLDWHHMEGEEGEPPSSPVMSPEGGGGGGRSWRSSFWVWPLPTQAPLKVVAEWPDFGVPITSADLPVDEILKASRRSTRFFE